jgi:hypothetical protein
LRSNLNAAQRFKNAPQQKPCPKMFWPNTS